MSNQETARIMRKARETLERYERAHNTPAAIAERTARQEKLRKAEADARIDAAVAKAKSQIAAKQAKAAPPTAAPRPAPQPVHAKLDRKEMAGVRKAVADAVAKEITDHRRERELQAAKIETALAKLDAALARAEVGSAGRDRDNRLLMVTR